jgi:poly(3-hydroxybutyrate) depolymerase
MRHDYIQAGVGHYGVFNGRRYRTEIYPRMRDFMRSFQTASSRTGAKKATGKAKATTLEA